MGRIIKLEFNPESTDSEIRQIASQAPNGEYTYKICRNCGRYWSNVEGSWKTAEILKVCRGCIEIPGTPLCRKARSKI